MELESVGATVTPMRDTEIKPDESSRQLSKLRVKILFEQSAPTQFGSLVIAILYVFLVRNKASTIFLGSWISCLLLC